MPRNSLGDGLLVTRFEDSSQPHHPKTVGTPIKRSLLLPRSNAEARPSHIRCSSYRQSPFGCG